MKTAIVGGGVGGLATAILLAERGAKVTLFEGATSYGGRARTTHEGDFHFNLGPHAIYLGGHTERVLGLLGGVPAGAPPKARGLALVGDVLHALPAGPLSLMTTGLFDLSERWEAARIMAGLSRLDVVGDESVGTWLERHVRHTRVRSVIAMFFRVATYTHPVTALRAKDALEQLRMATGPGVVYLDGGWQTLVDRLAARAEALGVSVKSSARVVGIGQAGGTAKTLEIEGGLIARFDSLVLATGPKVAAKLLPEDVSLAAFAERARPVEAACLDVAAEGLTGPATLLLGVDAPYYGSVHSAFAKLAPEGAAMIHVAKYLGPDDEATEAELRGVLSRMQPGIVVKHARFLPRIRVMNARVSATTGGVEGRIVRPDTPNVALVGDWVGSRGMLLDAVLASAEAAALALEPGALERGLAASA